MVLADPRDTGYDPVSIDPNPNPVALEVLSHRSPLQLHNCIDIWILFLYLCGCNMPTHSHQLWPWFLSCICIYVSTCAFINSKDYNTYIHAHKNILYDLITFLITITQYKSSTNLYGLIILSINNWAYYNYLDTSEIPSFFSNYYLPPIRLCMCVYIYIWESLLLSRPG